MSVTQPRSMAPISSAQVRDTPGLGSAPRAGGVPVPPLPVAPNDPRIGPLAAEFAARFGRYCDGMPAEAFERLVRRAAWLRLRWPS